MGEKIVELLRARRIKDLRRELEELNPADLASAIEDLIDDEQLSKEDLLLLFRIMPKDLASETFVLMESDIQQMLISGFTDAELHDVMDELFLDDAVDIIEEMPANIVKRMLKNVDSETRKSINQLLNYPEDSAGSMMTIEYVDLKKSMTVEQAFARIRKNGVDKETIYTCYVTDSNRKLLGLVTVKTLLLSNSDDIVGDIMEDNVISVSTSDDQEEVAQMFDKYDFMALPVVDSENRLVGIITMDDAIDVMQEEFTEDIEKMAAITPTDKPYLKMSVFELWKARIPWLLLLMVSATFTGLIITSFEQALAAQLALTAYIPMLMDTGGNSGSQSSVTVIRALSLGDIEFSDIFQVFWKEIRVAVLCALSLSVVCFAKLMLFDKVGFSVSLAVAITLSLTVVMAKMVGCLLPVFSQKLGFDPAVMSSPFITTIVDALSLLVYFSVATALLGL